MMKCVFDLKFDFDLMLCFIVFCMLLIDDFDCFYVCR